MKNISSAFLGMAIGDALGVPVEFLSRQQITTNPVTNMRAYGTHNQPAGTWSDDSSLAFCLAESLCKGYDVWNIGNNFLKWYENTFWTAHNKVFDVGIATAHAIRRIKEGENPLFSGGKGETDNGNGSLMRILPLAFYLQKKYPKIEDINMRFKCVSEVSSITHAHIRSILSCFISVEYALCLLEGLDKWKAFEKMQKIVIDFNKTHQICSEVELRNFHKILEVPYSNYEIKPLNTYSAFEIRSSGYVLHTLEASLWCFLNTENYADAVLQAVNLGEDTDTTGCVTGGLAGLYYGENAIPDEWKAVLVKKEEILDLAERMEKGL